VIVGALAPSSSASLVILSGDRIAVRHGSSVNIVHVSDIATIRAMRNVTCIATRHGELRVTLPFGSALDCLSPFGIMRIHRSAAVNVARILRIVGGGRHRLVIALDDGTEHHVGRSFQPELRAQLLRPVGIVKNA